LSSRTRGLPASRCPPLQCSLILTGFWGMFEVASARTRWQQAISEGLWPVQATNTTQAVILGPREGPRPCSPGAHARPAAGTHPSAMRRYEAACAACTLCGGPAAPPCVLLAPALVCIMQACCEHILISFAGVQVVWGSPECAAGGLDGRTSPSHLQSSQGPTRPVVCQ
jgi:hypothetical protein